MGLIFIRVKVNLPSEWIITKSICKTWSFCVPLEIALRVKCGTRSVGCYTQCLFNNGQLVLLWSGSSKSWSRIDFLSSFIDLHWHISLAYTTKDWLTWKLLVLFSELGGWLSPLPPPGYTPACVCSWLGPICFVSGYCGGKSLLIFTGQHCSNWHIVYKWKKITVFVYAKMAWIGVCWLLKVASNTNLFSTKESILQLYSY